MAGGGRFLVASCGDAPSAGVELNKQCDLGARQGVGLSVMNGWYMLPGETEAQWQRGECLYGDSERAWLQQPTRGLPGMCTVCRKQRSGDGALVSDCVRK